MKGRADVAFQAMNEAMKGQDLSQPTGEGRAAPKSLLPVISVAQNYKQ
jgi:hypothetical protein